MFDRYSGQSGWVREGYLGTSLYTGPAWEQT
jgi:hypothetical protein